jgi:Tol biopolymer transport system component
VEHSPNGKSKDVLPAPYSASSGIHEYGGASFCVSPEGNIIFVDGLTRTVFSLNPASGEAQPITEENRALRWADFHVHPTNTKWVLAVQEDHSVQGAEIENSLVLIDSTTKDVRTIVQGADFYSNPRFSPDGKKLCWVQWNHPDMPWTGSQLFVADWLDDGKVGEAIFIAGKAIVESVSEPRWGLDGTLFFASDRTGYLQLYRLDKNQSEVRRIELVGLEEAEFSGRNPALGRYVNFYFFFGFRSQQ